MTVMAQKKNNMKKGPFKMKGMSFKGESPAKNKPETKEKREVSRKEIPGTSLENRKKGLTAVEITYDDGTTEKVLSRTEKQGKTLNQVNINQK